MKKEMTEKNDMKRIAFIMVMVLLMAVIVTGCGGSSDSDSSKGDETKIVKDDAGREVTVPAEISKIAPSGKTATMMLIPLAHDMLAGVSSNPDKDQEKYLPKELSKLPAFGQFFGGKSSLNMEALVDAGPQVIFDLGDKKDTVAEDMDQIQKQTGLPAVFFDGSLDHMAETYRKLGKILGREEQAEKIAKFIDKTTEMARKNRKKIKDKDRVSVFYGSGPEGLEANADGSSQAQVIDFIGAKNAVAQNKTTSKGGGTIVSLENLYQNEPDVIILTKDGPYDELKKNEWSKLRAVKEGKYYEIPDVPYCWMSQPPSVNMVLGVWWLGQLVYPDVYNDYDMVKVAQEYYKLFWHYGLSEKEAKEMLARSYYK